MIAEGGKVPTLRLFFALWPDAALREALRHATRKAVRASGGRPVADGNLHITLAFLGSVPVADREKVEAVAAGVVAEPFGFALSELRLWSRAKTLVLAPAQTPPPLASLYTTLWERLETVGYARERRPFRPHVTLARKVNSPGEMTLRGPVEWRADSFALVRSVTDPGGAKYEVIRRWPLAPAGADAIGQ